MVEHFKKKFENKTDQELHYILDHSDKYNNDAVLAAHSILEWRKSMDIELVSKPSRAAHIDEERLDVSHFNPKFFFSNFGYSDFFTAFSSALLWTALQEGFSFYRSEYYFEGLESLINFLIFVLTLVINHIIYRLEHKYSNNYAGRIFHSLLILLFFIVTKSLFYSLVDLKFIFYLDSTNYTNFFAFVIIILFAELLISILKRFLKLIKWEIL